MLLTLLVVPSDEEPKATDESMAVVGVEVEVEEGTEMRSLGSDEVVVDNMEGL